MRLFALLGGAVALVIAGVWLLTGQSYTVSVALPSASSLIKDGTVTVNGFPAGKVKAIRAEGGQAIVTVRLDSDFAPVHEGAAVTVPFRSLLGERFVEIKDGPANGPAIPDGGMISGAMLSPVEVDQVLNALDPPTLARVRTLVNNLNTTVRGHEADINASVSAAGPALNALGGVLDAVGTDGPAIRSLVTKLNGMVGTLADRQQDVRTIVTEFSRLTALAAQHREDLRQGLRQLPPTLQTARTTLEKVPGTADEVVPLLEDLEAPTDKLVPVSSNLRAVFKDLRPTLHDLDPTLDNLNKVLDRTPDLLKSAHQAVPQLTDTFDYLNGPLHFLRPYTPEAIGWLANWNMVHASYDTNGNYTRIQVQAGAGTPTINPGVVPPGVGNKPYEMPGSNGGTPWADAWGSGIR